MMRSFASCFGLLVIWTAFGGSHSESSSSSQSVEVNEGGRIQSQGLDSTLEYREVQVHLHDNEQIATYSVNGPIQQTSSTKRQLVRSEPDTSVLEESPSTAVTKLEDQEFDGVMEGACRNYDKTSQHQAFATCPSQLKIVGCSCRDKIPERTGACSTEFKGGDTCAAYTMPHANITAYARCCNFKFTTAWTTVKSEFSGPNDGDGVTAQCPSGSVMTGCACKTGDLQAGCKMTRISLTGEGEESSNYDKCEATNHNKNPLNPHLAGVQAQALCMTRDTTEIEHFIAASMVKHTQSPFNMSTGLPCNSLGKLDLEMVSCSCSSDSGECGGGKVLGNKCECFGDRCLASSICASIPRPPIDCKWTDWSEWGECSVSCGSGTKSRIREMAMVAQNGGKDCEGQATHMFDCEGDGSGSECALVQTGEKTQYEHDTSTTLIAIIVCTVLVIVLCAGFACHFSYSRAKMANEKTFYGENSGQYGGYDGYGGYGGHGQQGESWSGVEAEQPAETAGEVPAS